MAQTSSPTPLSRWAVSCHEAGLKQLGWEGSKRATASVEDYVFVFLFIFSSVLFQQYGSGTETGTVGTVFPETESGTGPPEPFSRNRNRNRNRPFLLNCTEARKSLFAEEPPEPQTGTGRTVPTPNRNRTEPNRGNPDYY